MRYCIHMLEHRLQILLDEARYRKIARQASRRGTSVAAVIRDAIDRLPDDHEARRRAAETILAAAPMPVPQNPQDLRRELDAAHQRGTE